MALGSYAELKAAVARTLRRDDLTADIPDFILLAEARRNRRLRVRRMIERAAATLTDEYSSVPGGFLGVRTFALDGSPPRVLTFVTPDRLDELARTPAAGAPAWFTVVGEQFRYYPAPEAAATARLTYWQALPPLSDGTRSNWMLSHHPDAYLYGALAASAPFLKADERLATWGGLFLTALDDIEASDTTESFSGVVTPNPPHGAA